MLTSSGKCVSNRVQHGCTLKSCEDLKAVPSKQLPSARPAWQSICFLLQAALHCHTPHFHSLPIWVSGIPGRNKLYELSSSLKSTRKACVGTTIHDCTGILGSSLMDFNGYAATKLSDLWKLAQNLGHRISHRLAIAPHGFQLQDFSGKPLLETQLSPVQIPEDAVCNSEQCHLYQRCLAVWAMFHEAGEQAAHCSRVASEIRIEIFPDVVQSSRASPRPWSGHTPCSFNV